MSLTLSHERLCGGQTILQKKGHERLIYISEFISPETGRLVVRDANGVVLKEA